MAERQRIDKMRLQASSSLNTGGVTLVAVERVVVRASSGSGIRWCSAGKEPWALVVLGAAGTSAIGVDGRPMPLQPLLETVDGLATALGKPHEHPG